MSRCRRVRDTSLPMREMQSCSAVRPLGGRHLRRREEGDQARREKELRVRERQRCREGTQTVANELIKWGGGAALVLGEDFRGGGGCGAGRRSPKKDALILLNYSLTINI